MARIRTIKPSFFAHFELYQAEVETSLPLRIAYAGLWTMADREGRFKWSSPELKLGCLPYDNLDFSRVLDALDSRGFVVKYCENGRDYGWIPSFKDHQMINNKESNSILPEPNESNILTCEGRDIYALQSCLFPESVERKGKEGKGKEGKEITLDQFLQQCEEKKEMYIADDDPIFEYADKIGIPQNFMWIGWKAFMAAQAKDKKQLDWRATFRNYVRKGWLKVWLISNTGEYYLTTYGKQLEKELGANG
jgi:hypothetical protein